MSAISRQFKELFRRRNPHKPPRRKAPPLPLLSKADIIACISSLEQPSNIWERASHGFTFVVAVGLVIEYYDPIFKFWSTHDWKYIIEASGGILVTAGVAGEFLAGLRSTNRSHRLKAMNDELTLRSEQELAKSNERIAELNLKAEQERTERIREQKATEQIIRKTGQQATRDALLLAEEQRKRRPQ